jgi:hypothetical protein
MKSSTGGRVRKLSLSILILFLVYSSSEAQLVDIVFGPLDGEQAGILYVDTNQAIEVDIWIRTAPGISIVGFTISLASDNDYICSRDGGELSDYFYYNWDDVAFLYPYDDGVHTNQTIIGVCCLGAPDYEDGIHTEGEWFWMGAFWMTTVDNAPSGIPLCDAFIEGWDPNAWGTILADYRIGELDPSEVIQHFPCLWFVESSCGGYVVGDFNGSGEFNVADVVDGYSRLKTGAPDAYLLCECPPESGNTWEVAMDLNNSCTFNVADIVLAVHKLLGMPVELTPCWMCPPGEP